MPLILEETSGYQPPKESIEQLSSNEMAAVALIIQNFLDIMFDEIQSVGFVNIEFLEKSELFLRSITPSYPREKFDTLLDVFMQIDADFAKTKFYYGLIVLRQICTAEKQVTKSLLNDMGFSLKNHKKSHSSLVIFSSHLVENIIYRIKELRKTKGIEKQPIESLRYQVISNFNNCLLKTISEFSMTVDEVAN